MKNYTLMFSEIANSLGEEPGSMFTITHITNDENVLLNNIVTSVNGVHSGIQYDVTILAFNMAGSSESTITVCKYFPNAGTGNLVHFISISDTTGLQSSMVETNFISANITCYFAIGATGLGCHVSFGSTLEKNITRLFGSNVAMENVTFSQELKDPVDVTMAEILADGSVSFIRLRPLISITSTITNTSKEQHSDNMDGLCVCMHACVCVCVHKHSPYQASFAGSGSNVPLFSNLA